MGDTILHYAAFKKNKELISYLLKNGASNNKQNSVLNIIYNIYFNNSFFNLFKLIIEGPHTQGRITRLRNLSITRKWS